MYCTSETTFFVYKLGTSRMTTRHKREDTQNELPESSSLPQNPQHVFQFSPEKPSSRAPAACCRSRSKQPLSANLDDFQPCAG